MIEDVISLIKQGIQEEADDEDHQCIYPDCDNCGECYFREALRLLEDNLSMSTEEPIKKREKEASGEKECNKCSKACQELFGEQEICLKYLISKPPESKQVQDKDLPVPSESSTVGEGLDIYTSEVIGMLVRGEVLEMTIKTKDGKTETYELDKRNSTNEGTYKKDKKQVQSTVQKDTYTKEELVAYYIVNIRGILNRFESHYFQDPPPQSTDTEKDKPLNQVVAKESDAGYSGEKELTLTIDELMMLVDGLNMRYSAANDVGKQRISDLSTKLYEAIYSTKKDPPPVNEGEHEIIIEEFLEDVGRVIGLSESSTVDKGQNCNELHPPDDVCVVCFAEEHGEVCLDKTVDYNVCEKHMPTDDIDVIDFFIEHPLHTFTLEQICEYMDENVWAEVEELEAEGILKKKNGEYGLVRNAIVTRLLVRLSQAIATDIRTQEQDKPIKKEKSGDLGEEDVSLIGESKGVAVEDWEGFLDRLVHFKLTDEQKDFFREGFERFSGDLQVPSESSTVDGGLDIYTSEVIGMLVRGEVLEMTIKTKDGKTETYDLDKQDSTNNSPIKESERVTTEEK